MTTTAPYGTWTSPITKSMCAQAARPLEEPCADDGAVLWLEGVFGEGGRMTLKRLADGRVEDLVPAPFNVRSRVHEYGGGAVCVHEGVVFFSNFSDNRLYRRDRDSSIVALTVDSKLRYADLVVDATRSRLLAIEEDHRVGGALPVNRLVAVPSERPGASDDRVTLHEGRDFYSSPRLSPDGNKLAWIAWDHPQMPWDGTELWLADVADDGSLRDARRIAGGPEESLREPKWSPLGALHVVSDRSGWWNIHRLEGDTLVSVCAAEAEFGEPAWKFGSSMYDFDGPDIVAVHVDSGAYGLTRIERDGSKRIIPTTLDYLGSFHVHDGMAIALGASAVLPLSVVRIDCRTGSHEVIVSSFEPEVPSSLFSAPRRIEFAGSGGRKVHAVFYPPLNPAFVAPTGDLPPLIVQGHGGPTAMTNVALRLGNQFWTSRGFAILDLDYTGSSGYGRAYREALKGNWGIADVEDFADAARHLVDQGLVDPSKVAIRGGSASGYAVFCALAFHRVFAGGVSYYGVSDLNAIIADTHKFESCYGQALVGSADPAVLAARSPVNHVDRIDVPVLLFQGTEDRVVPPEQSESMFASLRARGIPATYLSFAGEGHGFRKLETLVAVVQAELDFYGRIFSFEPADADAARGRDD